MPVDPGEHIVEAGAQGKIAWKHSVTVGAKSDTKTIVVPVLDNAPAPPPTAIATTGSTASSETRASKHSPAGWVAIGFGAVGLGVGTYFGLRALSQLKEADKACDPAGCTKEGAHQNGEAIKSANLSTVGFSIGLVGVAVGTYLLLTSGGSSSRASAPATTLAASVTGSSGEVVVSGRF
jgi:hypothetical protein